MSLKQDLLAALESHRGADLSGQLLAEKLGVSRSAVWKAVNALRGEGYAIRSATHAGYRLAADSDLLSAEGIRQHLTGAAADLPVFYYKEIGSTNDEAKRRLADGFRGEALIAAARQTAGRGRNGHSFYSPDTGAYMTLILHPEGSLTDAVCLTAAAAVAVVRAVETLTDRKPQIKWVNDILLDGKKIAGILTEAVTDLEERRAESVIVGIGLNIQPTDFPPEIREIAGSLGRTGVTRNRIVAGIANELLALARHLPERTFLADYRTHSCVLGRKILYSQNGESRPATAVGIDRDGGLVVETADGRRVLHSGEIHVRLEK